MTTRLVDERGTLDVLDNILTERRRQDALFPDQELPDGTALRYGFLADYIKANNAIKSAGGKLTWKDVLEEEFYEALAETDPGRLVEELVQVAAVATRWVEDVRRRSA